MKENNVQISAGKFIHKIHTPAVSVFLLSAMLLGLGGCSAISDVMDKDRVDYKTAGRVSGPRLDVPPDLTQATPDNRYSVPNAGGTLTASGFNLAESVRSTTADSRPVAERSTADMRIEKDGSQRWLVVRDTPETLWPRLRAFWQDAGFQLVVDNPEVGIMETDWAENRAKIPDDVIRRTLGKALDSVYSTGERDRFRTRVERGTDGLTSVYITHRGAEEVLTGGSRETSVWTARPQDPQLEATFLSRLMVALGASQQQAQAAAANSQSVPDRAQLAQDPNGVRAVVVSEGLDRTWRRVGVALDRSGFTVQGSDRAKGLYYVRYVDQHEELNKGAEKAGLLSRIFHSKKEAPKVVGEYQIAVRGTETSTQVTVQDKNGVFDKTPVAEQILKLLERELR